MDFNQHVVCFLKQLLHGYELDATTALLNDSWDESEWIIEHQILPIEDRIETEKFNAKVARVLRGKA